MREAWERLAALGGIQAAKPPLAQRQVEWLLACLQDAKQTRFGIRHGFERLSSPGDYRTAVPLHTYEELRPWLEQIAAGVPDVLFAGFPVAFERTGGSEGGAKLVPYSQPGLRDFQRALRPWLGASVRSFGLQEGSCYWVTSPALRGPEDIFPGLPLGLPDSAYLGEDLLADLGKLSVLPAWVGNVRAEPAWRLATQYFLVVRSDLAFISLWSPTFFLVLLDQLAQAAPELDDLLHFGGALAGHHLPPDVSALERLQRFRREGRSEALWPRLRLVSAWADGASQGYARTLQARLNHAHFEPKGLLSTEGVVSTPVAGGVSVLAADSAFFEFLDEEGGIWFAHELALGGVYEVVLTTASGLYRYRTGDAVVCRGFAGDLPRIQFLGRLGLVSDLVGEKLTEAFVASCLEDFEGFRMLIPSSNSGLRYRLVLDAACQEPTPAALHRLGRRLEGNPQYAHARRMGQLAAVDILRVGNPLGKFTTHQASRGHRPGDLKVPALCPEPFWEMIFQQEHP